MKAILLVFPVLMAVVSGSAIAEWVVIERDTEFTVYVDPATIRRDGSMVKMWWMTDHKKLRAVRGAKPYRSSKVQSEYDCEGEQLRTVYMSVFSGRMGGGEVIESTSGSYESWAPVQPGSKGETMWKFACGKM